MTLATLPAAINQLEACLVEPVIPGELGNWLAKAQEACREAVEAYDKEATQRHETILHQIEDEDPGLMRRVQQMREEDDGLLQRGHQLQAQMESLDADEEKLVAQDETMAEAAEEVADAGLHWITDLRKQEAALTAWYQEAFNRDRGVAD